jgi:CBS domain-containing protein
MPHVYIAHRQSASAELARLIKDHLVKEGYTVFLDVEDGNLRRREDIILDEIVSCQCFLLVLDRNTFEDASIVSQVAHALRYKTDKIVVVARDGLDADRIAHTVISEISPILSYNWLPYNHTYAEVNLGKILSRVQAIAGYPTQRDAEAEIDPAPTVVRPPRFPPPPPRQAEAPDLSVADCMRENPLVVAAETSIGMALAYMEIQHITYLIVNNSHNALEGWVSKADLVSYLPSPLYEDARMTTAQYTQRFQKRSAESVSDHMHHRGNDLEWLTPEMALKNAIDRFFLRTFIRGARRFRIRQFPVLDSTFAAVGVLGYWMIINKFIQMDCLPDVTVGNIMLSADDRDNFIEVRPDVTLGKAEEMARINGWAHIVISDEQSNLVGMTTIEKIRRILDPDMPMLSNLPVLTEMRPHQRCRTLHENDPLTDVIALFANDDIGALPVVERGGLRLRGLLTYVEVLRALRTLLGS